MWASKYNERALLSMRKVGLDFRDLRMAVLVQRVVPAAYAFVIHTHNPSTGDSLVLSAALVGKLLSRQCLHPEKPSRMAPLFRPHP